MRVTGDEIYEAMRIALDSYNQRILYEAWDKGREVVLRGEPTKKTLAGDQYLRQMLIRDFDLPHSVDNIRRWRLERHPEWSQKERRVTEITREQTSVAAVVTEAFAYCEETLGMRPLAPYACELAAYTASLVGFTAQEIADQTGSAAIDVLVLAQRFPHGMKHALDDARKVMERAIET